MPYLNEFIKVDIIGDCFQKKEIWNTGFKLAKVGIGDISEANLQKVAEEVAKEWEKFFTRSDIYTGLLFSQSYRTTEVKASHVGTNGKVVGNTYTHFYDKPIVGVGNNKIPAPQTSIVGSLRSSKQRGPGSQGRMYLPGIEYTIGIDGLVPEVDIRRMANEFNAFINGVNDINDAIGNSFTVMLASPVGNGVEEEVTQTGMDRKVDTQRRRANGLTSDYLTNEVLI